jgi:hypothetical protein
MVAVAFYSMPLPALDQWLYVHFREDGPAHPYLFAADAVWAGRRAA